MIKDQPWSKKWKIQVPFTSRQGVTLYGTKFVLQKEVYFSNTMYIKFAMHEI